MNVKMTSNVASIIISLLICTVQLINNLSANNYFGVASPYIPGAAIYLSVWFSIEIVRRVVKKSELN